MWRRSAGRKAFIYGRDDPEKAREAAATCTYFKEDDEFERVSDDPRSCYNCRYRRWTHEGFDCMKGDDA